jgi:hypothetical protein
VPPRDAAALAEAISALLADPQKARGLGAAGRERVARHFSLARATQDLEALYTELLDAARRKAAHGSAGRFSRRRHRSRNLSRAPW